MFVEKGRLNLSGVQVIDRSTGELGVVTQSVDISGKRRLAGEALYSLPISGGEGDVVNVLNPNSKRTVQGVVTAAGHVTIAGPKAVQIETEPATE